VHAWEVPSENVTFSFMSRKLKSIRHCVTRSCPLIQIPHAYHKGIFLVHAQRDHDQAGPLFKRNVIRAKVGKMHTEHAKSLTKRPVCWLVKIAVGRRVVGCFKIKEILIIPFTGWWETSGKVEVRENITRVLKLLKSVMVYHWLNVNLASGVRNLFSL